MSQVHELAHPSARDAHDHSRVGYRVASCTQMLSCGTGSLARLCNLVGKCSDLGKPTKIARQIDEQD